ncbi:MAG: YdcF family protein [Flavobacteriales bacterium]|nr:YdcF family protein [Flavobacteriales bacterium]MCB9191930.1 YdcF family protein [Flavobacteriales bacterium]
MNKFKFLLLGLLLVFGNSYAGDRLEKINEPYDAIIVPGYPFRPNGKMNPIYKVRLYWAYHLYKEGKTKKIIVSGSAVHTPYVESKVYALYLIELGIDPDDIIIEDRAEHSLENVFYSMEIAKQHGFEKVAVVSDKAHSFMIKYLAKKFDHEIAADFIPARWRFVILNYWNKFDLDIDTDKAYQPGFVHISMKKTETQRGLGTSGHLWSPSKEVCWSYGSDLLN